MFFSKKKAIREVVETVEAMKAEPKEQATQEQDGVPVFRILVDGKVVYEGKSGSLSVQPVSQSTNYNFSSISQTIINGRVVGGSATPGISVKIEGDVHGDVDAPMDVTCGNVKGDVRSGMSATCKDVEGNVNAGMSVNCAKVGGRVSAGMNVNVSNR